MRSWRVADPSAGPSSSSEPFRPACSLPKPRIPECTPRAGCAQHEQRLGCLTRMGKSELSRRHRCGKKVLPNRREALRADRCQRSACRPLQSASPPSSRSGNSRSPWKCSPRRRVDRRWCGRAFPFDREQNRSWAAPGGCLEFETIKPGRAPGEARIRGAGLRATACPW